MYRRFKFMRLLPVVAALTATLLTVSCKTSESNYRQAYETALPKTVRLQGWIRQSMPAYATARRPLI